MPTYKNLPRGKQKRPDEFIAWTTHVVLWIRDNWRTSLELVGVAIVALAIIFGASNYWKSRSGTAAKAFYDANQITDEAEKLAKIDAVASKYSRTPAGQSALMWLGNYYFEKNDYDKALEYFKTLAGRSRNHPMVNIASLHRMADTELKKGEAIKAAELYIKAAADPHNLVSGLSRYRAGLCYEKAGDLENAAKSYRQVTLDAKDKKENTVWKDKSEERLIWLLVTNKVQG